jgi:hypothetical protein
MNLRNEITEHFNETEERLSRMLDGKLRSAVIMELERLHSKVKLSMQFREAA